MKLDVLISIICTDNAAALRGCLGTLQAACTDLHWEAVVIDNASSDGTREMVRDHYPWATLMVNRVRRGFSANHNQVIVPALGRERARYFLILNDDVLLDPRAVTNLVRAADAQPAVGALGPTMRGLDGVPQQSFFAFPRFLPEAATALGFQRSAPPAQEGWLNGSCILFRAEALRHVGSLDETFFLFFEDTDIGLRLSQAAWGVHVTSKATIVHLEHQTVARPAPGSPMEKQMHRSRYLYFRKHYGRVQATLLTTVTRMTYALRAGKAMIWAALGRDDHERDTARILLEVMRYSPRRPLAHESAARGAADQYVPVGVGAD